jgi:hypothetical protein
VAATGVFHMKDSWEELKQSERNVDDALRGTVETIQNLWNPALTKAAEVTDDHRKKTVLLAATNDSLKKSYDDIVKKLSEEITALTLGSAAVEAFKLQALGATTEQLKFVSSLEAMVKNLKEGKNAFGGLADADFIARLNTTIEASTTLDETQQKLAESGARVWDKSRSNLEKYAIDMANLNVLLKAGVISQEEFDRVQKEEAFTLGLVREQVSRLKPVFAEVRDAVSELFITGILHANNFIDALGRILDKLAEVILQALIIKPLFDWLGNQGGFLGAIFGGFLAGGGPAYAGTSYIVGENGPEVFTPSVSGTIIPNGTWGGGGTTYNIDARGADPTVEYRIRRAIAESENRAVTRSVGANREASLRIAT